MQGVGGLVRILLWEGRLFHVPLLPMIDQLEAVRSACGYEPTNGRVRGDATKATRFYQTKVDMIPFELLHPGKELPGWWPHHQGIVKYITYLPRTIGEERHMVAASTTT